MSELTQVRLKELLEYNHDDGTFRWTKATSNRVKVGSVAGSVSNCGYTTIRIDGIIYQAHRLVWLYVYGVWPSGDIDHINGIRVDNRLLNLRDVSRRENLQNLKSAKRTNKSGYLGVVWLAKQNKWLAQIGHKGKRIRIGVFPTPEQASDAYIAMKRKLHTFSTL